MNIIQNKAYTLEVSEAELNVLRAAIGQVNAVDGPYGPVAYHLLEAMDAVHGEAWDVVSDIEYDYTSQEYLVNIWDA